jgi:hypothetical protein
MKLNSKLYLLLAIFCIACGAFPVSASPLKQDTLGSKILEVLEVTKIDAGLNDSQILAYGSGQGLAYGYGIDIEDEFADPFIINHWITLDNAIFLFESCPDYLICEYSTFHGFPSKTYYYPEGEPIEYNASFRVEKLEFRTISTSLSTAIYYRDILYQNAIDYGLI